MRYGSLCSGIEAASVAWDPLNWQPAWLAEIEKFPSAVLAYHWPDVSNLGDMTTIVEKLEKGEIEAPDVLVGGTPCQAFSVAGLRESLDDDRGQLSLEYIKILNKIDEVRLKNGKEECICLWENVPGVLNTKDNAFGCFLAGLAGEDDPVESPGKRWTNAGYVLGPQRTVSWRVLDAQYFGVAQRRRRVFVVASAREGFDSREILFERQGLRRDIAPSREKRQGTAPNAQKGSGSSDPVIVDRAAFNQGENAKYDINIKEDEVMPSLVARGPHGVGVEDWHEGVHPPLAQSHNTGGIGMSDQELFSQKGGGLVGDQPFILRTDPQEMEVSEISTTLKARDYKEPQAVCIPEPRLYENHPNDSRVTGPVEQCPTISSRFGTGGGNVPLVEQAVQREKFSDVMRRKTDCIGGQHPHAAADTEICPTITEAAGAGGGHVPIVNDKQEAFNVTFCDANGRRKDRPNGGMYVNKTECAKSATAAGPPETLVASKKAVCIQGSMIGRKDENGPQGDGINEEIQFTQNATDKHAVCEGVDLYSKLETGDISPTLRANQGGGEGHPAPCVIEEDSAGFLPGQGSKAQGIGYEKEMSPTLRAGCDQYGVHQPLMQVRRLTPTECERLQGFPDGHTNIPFGRPKHKDQKAPDGHRYKALGNSMAVPVMHWLGKRIERYVNGEPIERERFSV